MSDDGFKLQVSYSTPPVAQYAKGNMLNIRADTVTELSALLDEAKKRPELAEFFSQGVVLTGAETPREILESLSDEQAIANIQKHLGPSATAAQVAVLVKRFNKTQEEASALTKAQASEIISGGSK